MIVRGIIWLWFKFWSVMWNDKVPLILNIILIGVTAWITYGIAPHINGKFERQKVESAYVLENLRSINGYISDIYVSVTRVNYAISSGESVPKEDVDKARESISRLNWKLIETAAVLKEDKDVASLEGFQTSVEDVGKALDNVHDVRSAQNLNRSVGIMSSRGVVVIGAIGGRASLDPKVDPKN